MWDNTLLAYADRSRIIPPEYRELICRRNGNILPTLLVDGRVAGVWRPVADGIEATAFHRLDAETWAGLAAEADALIAFLADRDPAVYHPYNHWWAKQMPRAEVRILPGWGANSLLTASQIAAGRPWICLTNCLTMAAPPEPLHMPGPTVGAKQEPVTRSDRGNPPRALVPATDWRRRRRRHPAGRVPSGR